MIYNPQRYNIEDRPMEPFIDDGEINTFLQLKSLGELHLKMELFIVFFV